MRKLLTLSILLIGFFASAQTVTIDTVINNRKAVITYPTDHDAPGNTKKYQLIIFFHGLGEVGADTYAATKLYGPHSFSAAQWGGVTGAVQLGNGTHYPIIISLKRLPADGTNGYMRPATLRPYINTILNRFRVKNLHLTGLSQGGWLAQHYATYKPTANDYSYIDAVTSVVNVQGVVANDTWNSTLPFPQKFGNAAARGLKYLGFEQRTDGRRILEVVDNMNDSVPGSATYYRTDFGSGGHCCFAEFFNPAANNWTMSNPEMLSITGTPINMNIYQWMLRQGDTSLSDAPVANVAPVVSVGADVDITLPTNSTGNKTMSVTDEGGTLSYAWSKIAGPSTFTITAPTSATSNFTGLVAGTYVFRGTATDTGALSGHDDFQVVVSTAGNALPVVSAGSNQTVTLPTNSITLTGTATDSDGTVSVLWSKVSGGTATITTPTATATTVTGLEQGTYQFELRGTDNSGAIARDTVAINVIPVATGEEKFINVNVYGGVNPYNDPAWNNWNTDSSFTFTALKYSTGEISPVSISINAQISILDNLANYGGSIFPPEVLRYASYAATGTRTISLSGLNPGKLYSFEFAASRSTTVATSVFNIGGVDKSIVTTNNKTQSVVYTNIPPTSAGVVNITLRREGTTGGNYFNGVKITEQASEIEGENIPPTVNAGNTQIVSLPKDSTQLAGSANDADGTIATYQWEYVSGPSVGNIVDATNPTTMLRDLVEGEYVFRLTVTDDEGATGTGTVLIIVDDPLNNPLVINAGKDTTVAFAQSGDVTRLHLRAVGTNTITAWSWAKLTGGAVTLLNANTQNATVEGLQPGNYSFEITGGDGTTSVKDTILVRVVDWQNRWSRPCRVGAPVTHVLNPTSATQLSRTYLVRDGWDIQGGDTVIIMRNPQNGGVHTGITLGGFGGMAACPVIVVNGGGVVEISNASGNGFFRFGNGDTNFVSHVKILGNLNPAVPYGFVHSYPRTITDPTADGFVGNNVTDLELAGLYAENVNSGVFIKRNSDSTRPWSIHNNTRIKNLKLHDIRLQKTQGEGFYIGHTSVNGDPLAQSGNNGHTVRVDSVEIWNVQTDSTGWDALQTVNARYSYIHDNIVTNVGWKNQSSQRHAIIIGGNTKGLVERNVIYNAKEGIRGTPFGVTIVRNNYIDSIYTGASNSDGILMSGVNSGDNIVLENNPPLQLQVYGNKIRRFERFAINGANNNGVSGVGAFYNNQVVRATGTINNYIVSGAGDVISNNYLITTDTAVMVQRINGSREVPLYRVTKGSVTQEVGTALQILQFLDVVATPTPNVIRVRRAARVRWVTQ